MPSRSADRSSSPLLKAALALLALTAFGGGFLVYPQLSPKPPKVSDPPSLFAEPEPAPEPEPPPFTVAKKTPEPLLPPPVQAPAKPEPPAVLPVDKIAKDQLGTALMNETTPERKLAIIRRLENSGLPFAPYAVATLFPDPDKRVRLESLRVVESLDKENHILMPKVHAVYMYEQDPEVKAVLDRLVQKFRPQEEAEYKARQAQAGHENGQ